ncbi:PPE family protein [Actinophytocola gossypii]|uniref:PPE domain-containing protein n=1 Tax=Actinophytocola gossypii TaxID=2812003 RepID=A0ABT2JIY2_9PSEU|nr:PPE family protein [Actinophytocola gossypii]MCT2587826.1 PPE domain-containing protein [Actinophytocola gossypii]
MAEIGVGAFGYRWESYSHEELYDMIKTGAVGASVVAEADPALTNLITRMHESRETLQQVLREAGSSWEGQAANSMADGVSPIVRWADEAAAAGEQSSTSLHQIADGYSRASNSMPEPVPVPSKMSQEMPTDFTGLLAGQTDEDAADLQAQQAHMQAVELMNTYTASNQNSTDLSGTFSEPPDFGIGADDGGGSAGRAGTYIDSSSFGGTGGTGGPGGSGGPRGGGGTYSPSNYSGSESPVGGYGGTPPPSGDTEHQSATNPSHVAPPPAPTPPPVTAPPPSNTPSNPFTPVTGVLTDPTTGRPYSTGRGGGRGPGAVPGVPGGGSGGGGGRGPGAVPGGSGGVAGRGGAVGGVPGGSGGPGGVAGRGGGVGVGPLAAEQAGARGAAAAGARGGAHPGGFGPMGAGARNEEDKERTSPEYLRDYNDEFWDDTPPVAPPVIGDEDD